MKSLSKVAKNLIGQPMFHLLKRARDMEKDGKRIIHFEIGDPNFDSPMSAIDIAKKALDDNLTHYTDSMGIIEFRNSVSQYTNKYWGFKPSIEQILECPANAIIDFTIRCTTNPGEEVIYPDPGFSTYYSAISYNGMVPIGIQLKEENNFRMNPRDVREKITDNTRLIIMNTPNNPTGSVMTKEEVLDMAQMAEENDIYLLSDEVYARITYDKTHYSPSIVDKCRERCILLDSLSKTYSMSGWRLGYAIGPEKLMEKIGLLLQTIMSCQPAFTQLGGSTVLIDDKGILDENVKKLRERRDVLIEGIDKIPGVFCIIPEGSFYVFVNIRDTGMSSDMYAEELLVNTGVCVLPGTCFGKYGEGYIRLCYASTSIEEIEDAIYKIRKFHSDIGINRCMCSYKK